MASDWLGITVSGYIEEGIDLPKVSNINDLSLEGNDPFRDDPEIDLEYIENESFISMICVDVEKYFENTKLVKKTLSIPKWANDLGNRLNLNFSKVLTVAIENEAIK